MLREQTSRYDAAARRRGEEPVEDLETVSEESELAGESEVSESEARESESSESEVSESESSESEVSESVGVSQSE